jgi:hypothetical protein
MFWIRSCASARKAPSSTSFCTRIWRIFLKISLSSANTSVTKWEIMKFSTIWRERKRSTSSPVG